MLIAYYFMWHAGQPAPEQCEGCTWVTSQVHELSYIHSRDATFAVFAQGPYDESARYRDFLGWRMPWYSALGSLDTLLVGRRAGLMHIVLEHTRLGRYAFAIGSNPDAAFYAGVPVSFHTIAVYGIAGFGFVGCGFH